MLEREAVPGGRAGRLSLGGYEFDTGPTVLTMPDLIAETLAAVGERLSDWLTLTPLDPAYRAHFPDGSTLDVIADPDRMAAEIARVCGGARGRRLPALRGVRRAAVAAGARGLHRAQPGHPGRPGPPGDAGADPPGRLPPAVGPDRATSSATRAPSGSSPSRRCTPGSPRSRRSRCTRSSPTSTRSAGVCFPKGGVHAVPQALAGAAEKHGVTLRYRHHGHPGRDVRRPGPGRAHRRRRTDPGRRGGAQPRPAGGLPRPCCRPRCRRRGWPACATRRPAWCCTSAPTGTTRGSPTTTSTSDGRGTARSTTSSTRDG